MKVKNWAAIFPGQGSQVPGMGGRFIESWPPARARLQQVDEVLGRALSEIMMDGPKDILDDTENSQPAIFTISALYWDWLTKDIEDKPSYVAGHSLGELSAVYASGAASFDEILRLVDKRSRLMKKAADSNPGKMAAVLGMEPGTVKDKLKMTDYVEIANYNCPGQIVISGETKAFERVVEPLREAGAKKIIPLPVSGAFHSKAMAEAESEFEEILKESDIKDPRIPVIGNVSAKPLTNGDDLRSELSKQITSSVLWQQSIEYMIEDGTDYFVEVGPQKVLSGFLSRIDKTKRFTALDGCDFSKGNMIVFDELIGA